MADMEFEPDEIKQMKTGFTTLRKSTETKPTGFWFCQEAADGNPRLFVAPRGRKKVPAKQIMAVKRTAKNKSRICEGVAWKDKKTRAVAFQVVKGKFNAQQFKKDVRKLEKGIGLKLGKITISLMDANDRAVVGQEMLEELDVDNKRAQARAETLKARAEAAETEEERDLLQQLRAQSLASIVELDPRERARYTSGAGAREMKHAQGKMARFKKFLRGRSDEGTPSEPSPADRWDFQQQTHAEYMDDRRGMEARYKQLQAALDGLENTEKTYQRARDALQNAAEEDLPPSRATALSEAFNVAASTWMQTLERRHQILAQLRDLGAALVEHHEDELSYHPTRASEVPDHLSDVEGWKKETGDALASLRPDHERYTRKEGRAGPQKTETAKEIEALTASAGKLCWPAGAREQETALSGTLEEAQRALAAQETDVTAAREEVTEAETLREKLDAERRELIRKLQKMNKKKPGKLSRKKTREKYDRQMAALQARLKVLDEGIQHQTKRKLDARRALLELQRAQGERQDAVMKAEEALSAHRVKQQHAAAETAEEDFDRAVEEIPEVKGLEAGYQDAVARATTAQTTAEEKERERVDLTKKMAALEAQRERLRSPLAGAGPDLVEAKDRSLQARADLLAYERYIEEVTADLPDEDTLAEDPRLRAAVKKKREEMEARLKALQEDANAARAERDHCEIRKKASGLLDQRRAAEQQLEQIENALKDLGGSLATLKDDLAALKKRAGNPDLDPGEAATINARVKELAAKRAEQEAAHDKLTRKRTDQQRDVETERAAYDAFKDDHFDILDAEAKKRRAARAALMKELGDVRSALERVTKERDDAHQSASEGEKAARKAQDELLEKIRGSTELREKLLHVQAMRDQEDEAAADSRLAEANRLAQANRSEVLAIQAEAIDLQQRTGELFSKLRDAEDIYEAGVTRGEDGLSLLERLSGAGESDPDKQKAMQQEYEQTVAAATKIINHIEKLKALGEPPESWMPLLDVVPKAFWPDRLVAEAQDYAEIEALFTEEDREAQDAERRERTLAEMAKTGVDVSLDVGLNVANLVATNLDALSAMGAMGKSGLDTVGAWQGIATIGVVANAIPLIERIVADGWSMPEGVSDLEMRQLREQLDQTGFEKLKAAGGDVAAFLDSADFALANFKDFLGGPALNGSGVLIPGPGIVFSAINTAIKLQAAVEATRKASGDHELLDEIRSGEDENLARAMNNRSRRSKRLAADAIVDTAVAATNTVATVGNTAPGGQLVAIGAWAAAATMDSIHRIAGAVVDWKAAAKAKETLKKARLGSRRAMMEIFDNHQKYATMLMVVRARDGNKSAMKFCCSRGLLEGEVVDSKASLALLRRFMLEEDGQSDDPGSTFKESATKAWDVLCKGGRILGAVATLGASEEAIQQRQEAKARKAEEEAVRQRTIQVSAAPSQGWFDAQRKVAENALTTASRRGAPYTPAIDALETLRKGVPPTRTQWEKLQEELEDTQQWRPSSFTPQQAELLDVLKREWMGALQKHEDDLGVAVTALQDDRIDDAVGMFA
ncbi:MAG: hypothetical protein AAFV53_17210 [Myxococcota bacterium]